MYKFQFIALLLLTSLTSLAQTNDTLNKQKKYRNFHELYKREFSVFDSIIKVNDTLYMRPIPVEPKIRLPDSVLMKTNADGVHQVVLSTIEVTRRHKNNDLSYCLVPEPQKFAYDKTPRSNYRIPYDEMSPIRSEIRFWKKTNTLGLDINQGTFSNWSAGGYSSVSGIAK